MHLSCCLSKTSQVWKTRSLQILKNQKVLKYYKYCDDEHKDQKYDFFIYLFISIAW